MVSYTFVDRESLKIPAEKIPGLGERKSSVGKTEGFSSFKDRDPRLADAFRALRTRNKESIFQESLTRIISFPIDGGTLLGASAGEWVGGLFYDPGGGGHQLFIEKDITGIERWRNVMFAVSGTYHMGMNEGIIYKITNTDGDAAITPWFILPGCPTAMWLTDKDLLVVECEGGTVAFSDFDQFRYYGEIPAIKSSEDGK